MSKQCVYALLLIATFFGFSLVALNIHRVEAQLLTVYIRANGDVDPAWVPIQRNGNIYTFTGDIIVDGDAPGMIIERDNITVDGAGYRLTRYPLLVYPNGIELVSRRHVTIRNLTIIDFAHGIYLQSSTQNVILGNNITLNEGNIYLGNASQNMIVENTLTHGAEAIQLYASSNNTIVGNRISDNSNGVWLRYNSTENVISGNNITANTNAGINLHYSHDNTISGNDVTNNWRGIDLSGSSNNTLSGNTVTGNEEGISAGGALVNSVFVRSMNNPILGNRIVNNTNGVAIIGVLFTISRNHIAENSQYGITLDAASNNTISANDILNNNLGVFYDGLCDNNTAYHNNFIDNLEHVEVSPGDVDAWDNGIEGNYYSTFTGVDSNRDGIGDTPYVLAVNNTDYYPLMGPFHSYTTSLGKEVNVISNSTITDFEYCEPCKFIDLQVSNSTANQTYGFCRLSIPYDVISPPLSVTVDGATPLYWNYTVHDNGTHRWLYVVYTHSTREIHIVPEFPSVLILPTFMIATLLAVIVYRRKRSE